MASTLRTCLSAATALSLTHLAVGANPALAQQSEPPAAGSEASDSNPVEDQMITVTGSRVARSGFTTPTPVTAISSDDLARSSPSTIADALRTMPVLTNTSGTQRNSGSTGGGQSFLNLRGLGATRTLTLLDGHRFISSNINGSVDANLIPSALIKRVEVVTGGASAAYGSDAVAGVVNFILDRDFHGLKANVQYGQTDHNDNIEYLATLSGGVHFADGRGKLIISGEYFRNEGIKGDARDWAREGWQIITNPAGAGTVDNPTQILASNVRLVTSYGGLITTGTGGTAANNLLFKGITFSPTGAPIPFNFGTFTTTGTQVGGDGIDNGILQQINRPLERKSVFGHLDFEATPGWNLFAEGSYGVVHSDYINGPNVHNSTAAQTAFISIKADNAYLPASIKTQMAAAGVTGLTMTRWDLEDGKTHTDNLNKTLRLAAGFEGKIGSWKVDGYFQWGRNNNTNLVETTNKISNFNLAIDAVVNPANNQIVCRSTLTDPTNGCVPFNPFGVGAPSAAALVYVNGTSPAYILTTQEAAGVNFSGDLFSIWAGPVSLAFGGEYRRETADVTSDAASVANNYKIGNQQPWSGSYNIKEAYAETVLPLAKEMPLLHNLELNGAVRVTDYSTSGTVTTWKAGISYSPVDDIRLRLTRSRDIRAPNLNELFSKGRQGVATVRDPFKGNVTVSNVSSLTTGNPNLVPEVANTLTYGAVFTPSFIPNFNLSVDYYRIRIDGAIATVTDQVALDQCFAGIANFCTLQTRDANGNLTRFSSSPINYSRLETSGIDIEASYRVSLGSGDLGFRLLANRVNHYTTEAPGLVTRDIAGSIVDSQPHWRGQGQISYAVGAFQTAFVGRYISSGTYDKSRTAAQLGFQTVKAQAFVDAQFSYDLPVLGDGGKIYLNIRNIFGTDPRVAPLAGNLAIVTNPFLYDTAGRMFRVGVKASF